MDLHLFSDADLRDDILTACRPYLESRQDAVLAYLPAGTFNPSWREETIQAFQNLAQVKTLDPEMMTLPEMEAVLRDAALLYIPDGNTFLLNHRVHLSRIMEPLRRKVGAGLPVVAFSAGTVLCGPNILTSNDLNLIPTTYFTGLSASRFNFNVHYPEDPAGCAERDEWLNDYHIFHDNAVLLLSDGACLRIKGKKTSLVRGEAWVLRKGREKQPLDLGQSIME
jgi:dipeptidase E